jgi:hypothetical protein
VICFDLISHQHLAQGRGQGSSQTSQSPEAVDTSRRADARPDARGDARGGGAGPYTLQWPPLAFDACNLFMLGSPLAMFLRLREATGERDEVRCTRDAASSARPVHAPRATPRSSLSPPPSPLVTAAYRRAAVARAVPPLQHLPPCGPRHLPHRASPHAHAPRARARDQRR